MAPLSQGARHHKELVVNEGRTASLPGKNITQDYKELKQAPGHQEARSQVPAPAHGLASARSHYVRRCVGSGRQKGPLQQ